MKQDKDMYDLIKLFLDTSAIHCIPVYNALNINIYSTSKDGNYIIFKYKNGLFPLYKTSDLHQNFTHVIMAFFDDDMKCKMQKLVLENL